MASMPFLDPANRSGRSDEEVYDEILERSEESIGRTMGSPWGGQVSTTERQQHSSSSFTSEATATATTAVAATTATTRTITTAAASSRTTPAAAAAAAETTGGNDIPPENYPVTNTVLLHLEGETRSAIAAMQATFGADAPFHHEYIRYELL